MQYRGNSFININLCTMVTRQNEDYPCRVTSCSTVPLGNQIFVIAVVTSFLKGDEESPNRGLLSAHPLSKRVCDPLSPVLLRSLSPEKTTPTGPSCSNTIGVRSNSHDSWVVVHTHSGGRGRWISVSSRSAWSTRASFQDSQCCYIEKPYLEKINLGNCINNQGLGN